MSEALFTLGDLLDHGLAAVPAAREGRLDAATGASLDVARAFRDAAGSAVRDAAFVDLADAVLVAQDPQATATAFINGRYAALGGAAGILGPTVTAVSACPDGIGWFRHFRSGSIYWHPTVGAHEVHGAIRAKWAELGWERSFLGYPTSDQEPGRDPDARGAFNTFQGGAILWHPDIDVTPVGIATVARVPLATALLSSATGALAVTGLAAGSDSSLGAAIDRGALTGLGELTAVDTATLQLGSSRGAHEVHGAIGAHYLALGGSGSFLGYPVTDETGTPDGVGRYNHFQAGSIYWTPSTGAHEVHGLIRGLWADHGWEQNPALGYPISDELIPDRRIGHRHPESRRKPLTNVPVDVVKLPAEAARVGFSPLVANVAVRRSAPAAAPRVAVERAAEAPSLAEALVQPIERFRPGAVVDLGPIVASLEEPFSTPAPEASVNRFGDFENGVLFWQRGSTTARQLQPWTQDADGASMRRSAGEVVAAMQPSLSRALGSLNGATLAGFAFSGTTGYSWDGASVRNRRHRVTISLLGAQAPGGGLFGGLGSVPVPLALEVQLEVMLEPLARRVTVCLADWAYADSPVDASPPLPRQLHEHLDPLLFQPVDLIELPDTDDGRPIAVLSVKTMPNGDVNVFVEPNRRSVLTDLVTEVDRPALLATRVP